ncbi:MAG: TRAP transporter substrate-binding protein, partial [Lachnospiraceae bacterium]|nr:TRAP transporter substrate-binding protein [Lachnospiraceae bacterium]
MLLLFTLLLSGCANAQEQRIVRIGHNQSTNHPSHIGLIAFQEYIHDRLGDQYVVEVYPSELLGSQTDMVQLTQTGAIDFCIASN